jgi:hypothetical protein
MPHARKCSALRVDEATHAVKRDAHSKLYVLYVFGILFCRPIDGRATSLEAFNIIKHFLEENEIICENYTGIWTRTSGTWTHSMLRKQVPVFRGMSEELQTVQSSELLSTSGTVHERKALLYHCDTSGSIVSKCFTGYLNPKKKQPFF